VLIFIIKALLSLVYLVYNVKHVYLYELKLHHY